MESKTWILMSLIGLGIGFPFFHLRSSFIDLIYLFLLIMLALHNSGPKEYHKFHLIRSFIFFVKQPFKTGNASEKRGFAERIRNLPLDNATENQCLPVPGGEVRLKITRIKNRPAEHDLSRHNRRRLGMNFQLNISRAVDVRRDFQNNAHVLVYEILAGAADRRIV